MSQPDLPSNETKPDVEVVQPIRRSVLMLAIRIAVLLFLVDTVYAGLLLVSAFGLVPADQVGLYATFLWIIYTLKYFVLTYMIIRLIINWAGTLYYVTGGHLIRQRGVLHTTETVFQLADVDSVVMSQSWLGRMLNFGDVTVEFTIAREKERVILYAIDNPRRYETLFSEFV